MQVRDLLNNVVFTILVSLVSASPTPEDWTVSAPFQMSSDNRAGISAMAFLNVTRLVDMTWTWDRREIARYGSGYVGPAKGILVHVTSLKNSGDHTGCQLPYISSKFNPGLPHVPWIALIKRGGCSFETKVENAFKADAIGVIVYNDRDSPNLDRMKLSSDNGRNISAVFTFKWKGEEMARYLENDSQVYVEITIGRAEPVRNAALNRTSVLFVSITFIVLMIISLAWLVFYYIQRLRHIHAKDKLSRRLCNAAKKALSKIPTKNIKSEDKEVKDGECCAVCIEPYKTLEVLRILPCTHEFHKNCIDPWLLEHRTCPMCKMDILKHYGFMFTDSQESILQVEIDEMGGVTLDSPTLSTELRTEGITPLPQIRAEIISNRQLSFDSSIEEDNCSRASTPNELTPTLASSSRHLPLRSEFCANCIAATSTPANVLVNNQSEKLPDLVNNSDKIDHRSVDDNHQSAQVQQ